MLRTGDHAPQFALLQQEGRSRRYNSSAGTWLTLLVFFETDCPTCLLTLPYLNQLAEAIGGSTPVIIGISQDPETATLDVIQQTSISFPVVVDHDLSLSKLFDPESVPTMFLVDGEGRVVRSEVGFDKTALNSIAAEMLRSAGREPVEIARQFDGAPAWKPGCCSRHLETGGGATGPAQAPNLSVRRGQRASRVELGDAVDPQEYCLGAGFGDGLPVVPPTVRRVEKMLKSCRIAPDEIVGLIPPNYGIATVEKIAANACMAGCDPAMMRVLVPLVRAICDERFNVHGVQATTHFAAPLVILNGPVRKELGFACGSNVFSNVARANSTVGRALQLILINLGGARPGEIDMSTLGNPGKFSYCIAENEEENPWEPFSVDRGIAAGSSAVTVFAAEPPRGVSEHNARSAAQVLKAISYQLATSFTYRLCGMAEALVLLCPEHVKTIHRDRFSKQGARRFLFENTGVPVRAYADAEGSEGTQFVSHYRQIIVDGEPCYQKFASVDSINIVVAGGTAGKLSAVISSWATGPRGSQMVTYPID
jgi:peroxiredoxin